MPAPQKQEQVALLTEKLRAAKVAVLTDYRGLSVSQIEDLRARLRGGDVEFRVIKNTLARRAAVATGHEDFQDSLKGPLAIAFGYDDVSTPVKLLLDFTRATRLRLDIVGGLVEGRVTTSEQVRQLADLPSREVLIAQLMGTVQSPVVALATALSSPMAQLAGALESYRNQLEAA